MDKKNVRIELNSKGVQGLLKSQEMMDMCIKKANEARSKLGDGYEVTSMMGKTRVNASIAAVTRKAKKDNKENNSILKALR